MVQWRGRRSSDRIEDRRGRGIPGGGLTIGGGVAALLVVVISLVTGADPRDVAQVVDATGVGAGPAEEVPVGAPAESDEQARFVGVVLGDTEETWSALFPELGRTYELPTLVLFEGAVQSACGMATAAVGPFYCPADGKVYLDLSFFRELDERFGAPGDFARAYVVAHEVGHHVQNQLGIADEVTRRQAAVDRSEANRLSVRMELQADCLAGVWGHHAESERDLLDPGDVEEGLRAAAAIGDDRLQREAGGRVVPDSFTHGSSEQRVRWFRRGLESGDPGACDTFAAGAA